jgi:hypothetical protein
VLDDDFFSSISYLEQKPSSGFQHAHRLPERGLFVGKEHDVELAHDCVKSGVLKGSWSASACCHLTRSEPA